MAVRGLLEEVVSAVEFAFSGETLFVQCALTLGAFHALNVPRLVQHFHQVALHDRLVAAGAHKGSDHLTSLPYPHSAKALLFSRGTHKRSPLQEDVTGEYTELRLPF